jgi:pilus assembly protein CpaC
MKPLSRLLIPLVALLLVPLAAAAGGTTDIVLAAGRSVLHTPAAPFRRVAIADPDVAEIRVMENSAIYILGRKIGTTNLLVWPRGDGEPSMVVLRITRDVSALQSDLARLFAQETQVVVSANGDSVVLSGTLADPGNGAAILDLARQFAGADKVSNLLAGGNAPQVLLEVKVAEVSKTLIDRLGAKLKLSSGSNRTLTLLGDFLSGSAASVTAIDGTDLLSLDAERRRGLIKILAEPTIMALSGEQGEFLAGGKLFIPVAQSLTGGASSGAVTLEEREFGVGVKFLPTVIKGNVIRLKVTAEVSEISTTGTTVSSGNQTNAVLPTIISRKTSTTIQLADGQSFAVGGLTKDNLKGSVGAIPGLGSLPILGALFRSTDFQNDRSELVFMVTARIARDPADAEPR